jgi:hypothetical protein
VVLRFWNNEVLSNLEGVLISILHSLRQRTPQPARASRGHPRARGEGAVCRARTPEDSWR